MIVVHHLLVSRTLLPIYEVNCSGTHIKLFTTFKTGDNRHRFGTTRSRIRSSYQTGNSGGVVHRISTERLETCTAHYVPFSQHCRDVRVVFLCSGRRKGGPQRRMWQWRMTRLAS